MRNAGFSGYSYNKIIVEKPIASMSTKITEKQNQVRQ